MPSLFTYFVDIDLSRPERILETCVIPGRFSHRADESLHFEDASQPSGLKLGFRVFDAEKQNLLFEDRADFQSTDIPPDEWAECRFAFPGIPSIIHAPLWLFVDILHEGEYWFSDRQPDAGFWFELKLGDDEAESLDQFGHWGDMPSPEARNLLRFVSGFEAFRKALGKASVVEVRIRGAERPEPPLLPHVVPIEVNAANSSDALDRLGRLGPGLECIIVRDVLQRLGNYRRFLSAAFEKLAVGGCLIVVVPHQFLFERKLQLPSRFDPRHRRFYSPSSLLAEIEEAIDPFEYRVRLLADNDSGYDVSADFRSVPAGGHDLVVCLEKVERPAWRDALNTEDVPAFTPSQPTRFLPPGDPAATPYVVVEPAPSEIRRILAMKLDHRGDFLMAEYAFRILRQAFPAASITLVCGEWNREQAEKLGVFDAILPFDFFPEDASAGSSIASYEELRQGFQELLNGSSYDLAIDFRLYEDTRELLKLVKAEQKAGFDPYDSYDWLTIRLNVPVPTRDGRAQRTLFLASDFHTGFGDHLSYEISFAAPVSVGVKRSIIWGPYRHLGAGNYDVEVFMEPVEEAFELSFDISAEKGTSIVAFGALSCRKGDFPRFKMACSHDLTDFEFRIYSPSSGAVPPFRFRGIGCSRKGAYIGVHQREAMALLAHLVPIRLQHAYAVSQTG